MNFNEWWAQREQQIIMIYGTYVARAIKDYAADAFMHGTVYGENRANTIQYTQRWHYNPPNEIPYIRGNPGEIAVNIGPSYDDIVKRALNGYWPDSNTWKANTPVTCKECGVVMITADGKSTLVASDNPDYCVSCKP